MCLMHNAHIDLSYNNQTKYEDIIYYVYSSKA